MLSEHVHYRLLLLPPPTPTLLLTISISSFFWNVAFIFDIIHSIFIKFLRHSDLITINFVQKLFELTERKVAAFVVLLLDNDRAREKEEGREIATLKRRHIKYNFWMFFDFVRNISIENQFSTSKVNKYIEHPLSRCCSFRHRPTTQQNQEF